MKQMDVFKKIGGILQELNDQYDYLKAESSDLNELELELFVANAHFLKDHAEILRKIHERKPAPADIPEPVAKPEPVIEEPKAAPITASLKQEPIYERRFFEPVVQQKPIVETKLELTKEAEPPVLAPYNPVKPEIEEPLDIKEEPAPVINLGTGSSSADSYSFERQEPEIVQQELVLDEAIEPQQEIELIEPVVTIEEPVEVAEPIVEEPTPAPQPELFKPMVAKTEPTEADKVLTFNQKISAQIAERDNNRVASPVNILPITDLKSAINLNDKLLYIKDLFNGYSLAYSEAIEIVNRFNTFDEAERFLKTNYVAKNNWDSKAATTEKFYTLLKRRYPTV
ncbi:hypothetical protein [Mucilaginibacter sp. FT3.2]|uniref:hypothetical protein n=1 Tax=Mucilaginibacter sp. FT3.2 TaxID=2723090 RepID=UPI00161BA14D|nr:hypothetical protein [Mucilaginibacter sp. FT3.2]MBB6231255.1 hypothetical protein [Mucilaginibacter sp. FT3.2]